MKDLNDLNDGNDDELRQRLRAQDPAASLPPADPSRVARQLEDVMDADLTTEDREHHPDHPDHEDRSTGTRDRSPLTWLVGAAAVLIAGVGVAVLLNDEPDSASPPSASPSAPAADPEPIVTRLEAPTPSAAKCMVPDVAVVAQAEVAFAGTVDQVSGEVITLAPDRFYAGAATDVVEVRSSPELLQALVGAVDFQQGERYLVSASDGAVRVCGLSGPFTPDLEALYVAAFPG